jgi:Phage tail lysozyme
VSLEKEVYDALTRRGLSSAQAAGIMGSLQNESGFDPEAENPGGPTAGLGLAQWETTYYPQAARWVTGNVAEDLAHQAAALVSEARHLDLSGSAGQVAGVWASQFERCAGCQPGGAQYDARVANAERIYRQAQSGNWPSGPGISGGGGQQAQTTGGVGGIIEKIIWPFGSPIPWLEGQGQTIGDIGTAIEGLVHTLGLVESWLTWAFKPNHIIRIVAFITGVPLVALGLLTMTVGSRPIPVNVGPVGTEVSGGSIAPAIGILETTLGAVALFIAFHNLPPEVDSFAALIAYLQGEIQGKSSAKTAAQTATLASFTPPVAGGSPSASAIGRRAMTGGSGQMAV